MLLILIKTVFIGIKTLQNNIDRVTKIYETKLRRRNRYESL